MRIQQTDIGKDSWFNMNPLEKKGYGGTSTAGVESLVHRLDFRCQYVLCVTQVLALSVLYLKGPCVENNHNDVIKWWHFPRYWPFVREIHRSPVNSPHKGQWRGALTFFICSWINVWVNNRQAGNLRRYRAHYDVIVMMGVMMPLVSMGTYHHMVLTHIWLTASGSMFIFCFI